MTHKVEELISSAVRLNRTGISASPIDGPEMIKAADAAVSTDPDGLALAALRGEYARTTETIGSVPPPTTLHGVAETAMQALKGHKVTLIVDQVAERLAFERTGVRLYEGLIDKFDAVGSFEGGPTREELVSHGTDELRHFTMLLDAARALGADPTAVTPQADIAGVESEGLLKVVNDPRTSLGQALHAILVAELVDSDGWTMLIDAALSFGEVELAGRFTTAAHQEEAHVRWTRRWLAAHIKSELGLRASRPPS